MHPCETILAKYGQVYSNPWFKAQRLRDRRDWPEQCYLPLAGWYAIFTECAGRAPQGVEHQELVRLAALGAWREHKGVYTFQPALYDRLIKSKVKDETSIESLLNIPDKCVYVETPGFFAPGFFAFIDQHPGTKGLQLYIVLRPANFLFPMPPVYLDKGSWRNGIDKVQWQMMSQAAKMKGSRKITNLSAASAWEEKLYGPVNLLLYLCSGQAKIKQIDPHQTDPDAIIYLGVG